MKNKCREAVKKVLDVVATATCAEQCRSKAGVHKPSKIRWIPACAGMTVNIQPLF